MNILKNLLARRKEVVSKANELLEQMSADDYSFTAEDKAKVERMREDVEGLDSQIDAVRALEKAQEKQTDLSAIRDAQNASRGKGLAVRTEDQTDSDLRKADGKQTFRVDISSASNWLAARKVGVSPEDMIRAAERGQQYYVHRGEPILRKLNVGTSSQGGTLVPSVLATNLYRQLNDFPGARAAGARVIQTAGGGDYSMPQTGTLPALGANVAADIVAESAQITENQRTFGRVTFGAYKFDDRIDLTNEFIEDEAVPLGGYIGDELGIMIARKSERAFHIGSGTNQPQGYGLIANHRASNADLAAVTRTANDDIATVAEVLSLVTTLDEDYDDDNMVRWLGRRATYERAITSKGTDGHYLIPSVFQHTPIKQLRGYRWVLSRWGTDLPGPTAAGTDNSNTHVCTLAWWDRFYYIREARTMTVRVNPYIRMEYDEVVYSATVRLDGRIFDRRAAKVLFSNATAS